jgi:hypothetical protein
VNTALAERPSFDMQQHQPMGIESAATAAASKAKALVEARYIMAMRNPRNWDQVRQDLLKECRRPSFADNKSAFYVKPIGDGVEGLGIRFVEVALRCMKNVMVESEMVFEDTTKEVHQVTVTDLESNVPWSIGVNVPKTVERSKPSSDGSYISVRKNSWGRDVYTVPAEGDDILNKRGALLSKAVRTLGLRIIPGDLQDEAEAIIKQVRTDKAAQDPDAERKRILDAFAELGVKAIELTEYLGHDIATCSPAEMVKLRGLYGAIRDGEATWASVLENKAQGSEGGAGAAGAKPPVSMPKAKAPPPPPPTPAAAAGMPTPSPSPAPGSVAAGADPDTGELFQTPAGATEMKAAGAPRAANGALATDGERQLILRKARSAGVEMADLMEQAGLTGLPADLAGLTKDGFIALKDALPQ